MPIREKFQLDFGEEQDERKNETAHTLSQENADKLIESESKHKIKIILNILSDDEISRIADKQE